MIKKISDLRSEGFSAGFTRRKLDIYILLKFLYETSRKAPHKKAKIKFKV